MRFLVDAQLPPGLVQFLEQRGHEAKAVRDVGLREATDRAIWDFAISGNWVVVTKDEDFAERALQAQVGPKILWLRIGKHQPNSVRVVRTAASSRSHKLPNWPATCRVKADTLNQRSRLLRLAERMCSIERDG